MDAKDVWGNGIETNRQMVAERTSSIQGLRVLFILSIIFMHAGLKVFGEGGELCSFFFVVSGFLFAGKQVKTLPYMKKKLSSMYPIYLIFLAIWIVSDSLVSGHVAIKSNIVAHLLLLQSWRPAFVPFDYLGTAWFLSSLLFCYACGPTLSRWLSKWSKPQLYAGFALLTALFLTLFTPPL